MKNVEHHELKFRVLKILKHCNYNLTIAEVYLVGSKQANTPLHQILPTIIKPSNYSNINSILGFSAICHFLLRRLTAATGGVGISASSEFMFGGTPHQVCAKMRKAGKNSIS